MTTCWTGPATTFEARLMQPMAGYALEQLRQRFLFTLTTSRDFLRGARVLMQMAFETEASAILRKLLTPPADLATTVVCERRRYLDVDQDMSLQRYLVLPALDALAATPTLPPSYVDFLGRYLASPYPRYRMAALAVALCLAKQLQP